MLYEPHNVVTPLHRVSLENIFQELEQLLTTPSKNLSDFMSSVACGGGRSLLNAHLADAVEVLPVFRTSNTSGYNYSHQTKMLAYLRFGVTTSGYFVVQTLLLNGKSEWISHYYQADGNFAFSEGPITHTFSTHKELLMETHCPILNHIYNILSADYLEANEGYANTKRAHTLETILRRLEKTRKNELSVTAGAKDQAIHEFNQQMMAIEMDPIYTWKERFRIYKGIKAERTLMINTKKRAHHKSLFAYRLPIFFYDAGAAIDRFFKRPVNNFFGTLDRVLFDPFRWFVHVVKDNMGYSIALAIYSPFTFFFITQPMNPHATWAVGKVRTAYIETTDKIQDLFTPNTMTMSAVTANPVSANTNTALAKTAIAATAPAVAVAMNEKSGSGGGNGGGPTAPPVPAVAAPAEKAAETGGFFASFRNFFSSQVGNNYSNVKPTQSDILLSTDVKEVNEQNWDERMSNFKAMQIGYESNLEAASRLGRLEQMETQLNWPLHMESTWVETERYLNFLEFLSSNAKDYLPAFNDFVKAEKLRTEQTQLYLWDRNTRFVLDHPYTMMDQSGEQTQLDYYVGRAFILLRDMTNTMAARHKGLVVPAGYDNVMKLAQRFEADYKKDGGILNRLSKNSKVFAQKDPLSTDELRHYMKRQWEVLYLLQNRAQEGGNLGLQMYIWSVRNAVFLLQSIYSAKHEDLSVLSLSFRKGAIVNKLSSNSSFKQTESQYEALFHMMVLEYTSLRKEIGETLKKDVEATQRKTIIDGMQSFFKEREALLKGANLL